VNKKDFRISQASAYALYFCFSSGTVCVLHGRSSPLENLLLLTLTRNSILPVRKTPKPTWLYRRWKSNSDQTKSRLNWLNRFPIVESEDSPPC